MASSETAAGGSYIFVLRLESSGTLEAGFAKLLDSSDVSSCVIEPDNLQIRFVASAEVADQLIQKIYMRGGLVWSSRHALSADPPAS
jgi:hypothetical protein